MRRRDFLFGVALATLAAPLDGAAQRAGEPARALGLELPPAFLARADEAIE